MAYPFAAAEVLTAANLNAMIGAPTQNNQTGTTYSLALLDAGKTVTLSNASPVTVTVPAQATVTWANNTEINLLNIGAGLVTIAGAVGVTINGTPLTLATSKGGTLIRTASNAWTFVPAGDSGKILQVVRAADTSSRTTTSLTFVDVTGMSVTITPQRDTSAILIISTYQGQTNTSGGNYLRTRITDSSNNPISGAQLTDMGDNADTAVSAYQTLIAYATPATSSAVTYKLQFRSNSAGTTQINNNASTGQMYAIEVAA